MHLQRRRLRGGSRLKCHDPAAKASAETGKLAIAAKAAN